ncbi:curli assembly protein CsgF [Rhizobium sp. NTR19]|uniref:Curli production assembly/transport component CsgF n=1 Tax=Neorhizobium turbinariae TaxID=2937795 RepID=A0ABT0IQF3_9HYPH|nr:curli assembly protein CsgF [Neorhizobium turbinariae]MCK8780054.1 curli assembly protein CsgF [Neorhizobium turbinariae]
MQFTKTVLVAAAVMTICGSAQASQLVYRPTNPSLGGDPLNGNWLLSQASAQGEGASQSPGFSIDFPDFGGTPQPTPTPTPLPDVDTP